VNRTRTLWPYLVVVGLLAVICARIFISRSQDSLTLSSRSASTSRQLDEGRGGITVQLSGRTFPTQFRDAAPLAAEKKTAKPTTSGNNKQ
jgi:hypothetical protein